MKHHRTCNLCEAMCGLVFERRADGELTLLGDELDPLSRGHLCPKAIGLLELQRDPDRLRAPLVRGAGGGFVEASWSEAFEVAARGLVEIRRRHGKDAVALYRGNPVLHQYGAALGGEVLAAALGTRNKYSSHSLDGLPHQLAALRLFGHPLLLPVPDLDRTEYLLVLGANPLVSNGSVMSAPGIGRRLQALRARGGKLVVLDPRRTETAKVACEHHFVRPGGDALALLGMVHTLFDEGLTKVGPGVRGLESLRAQAARFAPERVAPHVGVAAPVLRRLARELAAAPAGVCYGRMGVCAQEFGATAAWLVLVMNVLTGNLDRPGGAMFTTPAFDLQQAASLLGGRGSFDRDRSAVRGLPEFGGEFPAAALADEIAGPGDGRIRALVSVAGNLALSVPGGGRMRAALATLEHFVAVDHYVNETTCHAHVILPPVGPLERDQYNAVFNAYAVRNVARYAPPLLTPAAGSHTDWSILVELASRVALGPRWAALGAPLLARLRGRSPSAVIDLGLRLGAYRGLSLRALARHPHGLDLGPLVPALAERIATRSGQVELSASLYAADLGRLEQRLERPPSTELVLIGRRELRSNNSWLHNAPHLVRGRPRCTLLMHPGDAAARGLLDGGEALVGRSGAAPVRLPVELSDDMMPGVVSMPHGYGHREPAARLRVASAHPGVSMNDVLDGALVDGVSGTARLNGVPVEVVAAPPAELDGPGGAPARGAASL